MREDARQNSMEIDGEAKNASENSEWSRIYSITRPQPYKAERSTVGAMDIVGQIMR